MPATFETPWGQNTYSETKYFEYFLALPKAAPEVNQLRQVRGNNISPNEINSRSTLGDHNNKAGLAKTCLELKPCRILFTHRANFIGRVIMKFCSEHSCNAAVLCTKFHNDFQTDNAVMGKRDFAKFEC